MCRHCMCVCINTCTYVSACVRDNSVAEGIQSPPPPWEIKAISAAQDVESEVIHTQGPGLPARGASALVSTSNSQRTQFTFKELGKKLENFALWNLFSAFCVLLANNASSYQTFWNWRAPNHSDTGSCTSVHSLWRIFQRVCFSFSLNQIYFITRHDVIQIWLLGVGNYMIDTSRTLDPGLDSEQ